MISSKNHRIVTIFCFENSPEILTAFEKGTDKEVLWNLAVGKLDLITIATNPMAAVAEANIAWFIACGYLPFSNTVKISYLPTIDHTNYKYYVFDDYFYSCPHGKYDKFIFDRRFDREICPNCGNVHIGSPLFVDNSLLKLQHLWLDFPIFRNMKEMGEDFDRNMLELNKTKYPMTRLKMKEQKQE